MRTKGINHLALVCRDMGETVRFYRDVLGMPLIKTIALPTVVSTSSSTAGAAPAWPSSGGRKFQPRRPASPRWPGSRKARSRPSAP